MYKIGSFNCLGFGLGASKDIQVFLDIIQKEKFDVVALQEIKGPIALNLLLKHLPNWQGVADDCPGVNDYAFIWNTARFTLAETDTKDGKRVYQPRIYKQYKIDRKIGQMDLKREPYFARFFPVGGGVPFIEIRLLNTHIRFSKGRDGEENPYTQSAIAMRRNEFDILTKAIYAKEADKRYGNNRSAYTILLGDYNLNLKSSGVVGAQLNDEPLIISDTDRSKKKLITVQHELSTLKSKVEEGEDIFSNNYDHFTYDANRFGDSTVEYCRINSVQKYCGNDYEKHRKNVSDHVPIAMNIDFRGETSYVENLQFKKGGAVAAIARESCRYARKLAGDTRKFGKDTGK